MTLVWLRWKIEWLFETKRLREAVRANIRDAAHPAWRRRQ